MYQPKLIREAASPDLQTLALKLLEGRVTLFVGAGISRAEPANLPSGRELAEWLAGRLDGELPADVLTGIDRTDLLAVADAISQVPGGLRLMQTLLANGDVQFDSCPPNFGHQALGLLFAEKLITTALSMNYDTCAERSAIPVGSIHVCRIPGDLPEGGPKGRLLKVHGCITKPDTLLLTSDQLNAGPDWALNAAANGIETNAFVFIGVGSIPAYLEPTLRKASTYARRAESIWIVARTISDRWDDLLGAGHNATKLALSADEFFDELLRACVRQLLGRCRERADALDTGPVAPFWRMAFDQLDQALSTSEAVPIAHQLHRGALPQGPPQTIAFGSSGVRAILALALVRAVLGKQTTITRTGGDPWLSVGEVAVEFVPALDAQPLTQVMTETQRRLELAKRDGRIPVTVAQVLILTEGSVGGPPPSTAPDDIVTERAASDIIGGKQTMGGRWLSIEDLTKTGSLEGARAVVQGALAWH